MVKVFALDIQELGDPLKNPELMEKIPEYRQQKIMKCKQADARIRSLGAGLLLKQVLKLYGLDEAATSYGENGKPEIAGLCFNLSHSGEMVVCAVGSAPVGCDIEKIHKSSSRIARRYFCESEREYLDSLGGEEKTEEFIRLWTIKESYLKMTGEGMKIPLNQFEVVLGTPIQIYRDGVLVDCVVMEYELEGYKLTVCSKEEQGTNTIKSAKYCPKMQSIFIDTFSQSWYDEE